MESNRENKQLRKRYLGYVVRYFEIVANGTPIGHGQKGVKSPSYSCSKMAPHAFSDVTVTFLPFFFFVFNMKKANLYKIWPNRLKTFFSKSCMVSNTEQAKTNHRKKSL